MSDIDDLRKRYQQAQTALHDAERDLGEAEHDKEEIGKQLTTLGFNVDQDLESQLAEKERELDGLITDIESFVQKAEDSVPTD